MHTSDAENAIHIPPVTAPQEASTLRRVAVLLYGTICYVMFLGVLLYAIGFIVGFGVPVTLDSPPTINFVPALLINLGLLGLFAVQHSVMARPTFKRWWTKFVPVPAERSTYVLFSNLAMIAMFALWQPMGGVLWSLESTVARGIMYGLGGAGWLLVLSATFMICHFDLFGIRQVWLYARKQDYTPLKFKKRTMYSYVRHPLYLGWLMAFWFTPTMTAAHLVFAVMTTLYILVAIQLEERNLVDEHGETYREYRQDVPMIIPLAKGVSK